MNEIATGSFPFSDCTKDNPECHTVLEMGYGRQELAAAVAAAGLRPTLPGKSPPGFADLMAACWAADPAQRPPMDAVAQALAAMQAALPAWQAAQVTAQPPAADLLVRVYAGEAVRPAEAAQRLWQWPSLAFHRRCPACQALQQAWSALLSRSFCRFNGY